MGTAIAKSLDGFTAVAPKSAARIVDTMPDGIVIKVQVTDQMLGALVRGTSNSITVAIVGEEYTEALRLGGAL